MLHKLQKALASVANAREPDEPLLGFGPRLGYMALRRLASSGC